MGDPVAMGFVSNLARPGGNVTGISNISRELAAKRLALIKEAVPEARRIAAQKEDVQRAAPALNAAVKLAAAHRLPVMGTLRTDVEAGGLMCRMPRTMPSCFVDRILKGSRPGDLPVELPTKFVLVINTATAPDPRRQHPAVAALAGGPDH